MTLIGAVRHCFILVFASGEEKQQDGCVVRHQGSVATHTIEVKEVNKVCKEIYTQFIVTIDVCMSEPVFTLNATLINFHNTNFLFIFS